MARVVVRECPSPPLSLPLRSSPPLASVGPGPSPGIRTKVDLEGDPEQVPLRKCAGNCKKTKPASQFWAGQGPCKECVLQNRKLDRRATAQGLSQWLVDLKQKDPKGWAALNRDFAKHCAKNEPPSKFCLLTWRKRWYMKSGNRAAGRFKRMWQREYFEFKATTAEGSLTAEEATILWNNMKADTSVKRDNRGPGGGLRLRVKIGDYDSDFDEVGEEDSVEATLSSKKNAKTEDAQKLVQRAQMGSESSIFHASDPDDPAAQDGREAMLDNFKAAISSVGIHLNLSPWSMPSLTSAMFTATLFSETPAPIFLQ